MYVATADLRSKQAEDRNLTARIRQEISNQGRLLQNVKHELLQRLEEGSSTRTTLHPEPLADWPMLQSHNEAGSVPGADTGTSQSFIQFELTRRQGCQAFCICSCHQRIQLRSPSIFDCILGSLFFGYVGFPEYSQSCDFPTCRKNSEKTVLLRYVFPGWLLKRILVTKVALSNAKGPEMLLRCLRVRPGTCELFNCITVNDHNANSLDFVRGLLKEGKGSVLDVDERGQSALHVGVVIILIDLFINTVIEGTTSLQGDRSSYSKIVIE